jgi:hypothetical protein
MKNLVKLALVIGFIANSSLHAKTLSIVRIYIDNYSELEQKVLIHFPKEEVPEITGVSPKKWYDLLVDEKGLQKIKALNIKYEITVPDLEKEKSKVKDSYHSYDQIVSLLRNYALSYPAICKIESIGPTYEGRWIYGVKISDNVAEDEEEPEQLFSGCHHAREWASVEVPLFIIDTLLRAYGFDQTITNIVNNREIWVFPVINVDGYVYDYSGGGRSWRKDREPYRNAIGTDPNRNYNGICDSNAIDGWGVINSSSVSHNPSQETFCGKRQHSAREISAYSEFIKSHKFVTIVDYHSYSELVLAPWGHKQEATPHDNWYNSIGSTMANLIGGLNGGTYTYEKSVSLYPTSGSSTDWEYGWYTNVNGTPCLAFTVEIGTAFYQNTSDLPYIKRQNFNGALFLLQKGDSIYYFMKTIPPAPIIVSPANDTVLDSIQLIWTVPNKEFNQPTSYEIQILKGLNKVKETFEGNTSLWDIESFSLSTQRAHSSSKSLKSDPVNYAASQARTKFPYYVEPGDSFCLWTYYDIETDYDAAIVEISENLREWLPLENERITGQSSNWIYKKYDISNYAGKGVYFRVRYMTDEYTLYEGIYIDDVYPVASWDSIATLSNITDTTYVLRDLDTGFYYIRVRAYSNQFGYGNYSTLKKLYLTRSHTLISEAQNRPEISVPSFAKATINIFVSAKDPELIIFDAQGRKVWQMRQKGDVKTSYQLKLRKEGVYFYLFKSGNHQQRGKILYVD